MISADDQAKMGRARIIAPAIPDAIHDEETRRATPELF